MIGVKYEVLGKPIRDLPEKPLNGLPEGCFWTGPQGMGITNLAWKIRTALEGEK